MASKADMIHMKVESVTEAGRLTTTGVHHVILRQIHFVELVLLMARMTQMRVMRQMLRIVTIVAAAVVSNVVVMIVMNIASDRLHGVSPVHLEIRMVTPSSLNGITISPQTTSESSAAHCL